MERWTVTKYGLTHDTLGASVEYDKNTSSFYVRDNRGRTLDTGHKTVEAAQQFIRLLTVKQ